MNSAAQRPGLGQSRDMCKMIRQFSGEWEMTALGDFVDSRTVRGMVKPGGAAL